MVRPKSGPSDSLLRWTLYVILLVATSVALVALVTGVFLAGFGASLLLWRVIVALTNLCQG